jgi:RNase P protein component
MPARTDMVFIALKGAASLDTHQLHQELTRFFESEF